MKILLLLARNFKRNRSAMALLAFSFLMIIVTAVRTQAQIYMSMNDGTGSMTNADAYFKVPYTGGSYTAFSTGNVSQPNLFALDGNNNRMFAAEGLGAQNTIKVINLATGTSSNTINTAAAVYDLEYDVATDYLYYITEGGNGANLEANDALWRVHGNGTGNEKLVGSITKNPYRLELDLSRNRVIIFDSSFSGRSLKFVDLATNTFTSRSFGGAFDTVWDIAYDEENDYIYYTREEGGGNKSVANDQLRRQKSDGTGDVVLISNFLYSPCRIGLDLGNNRLFVTDSYYVTAKLVSVNLADNSYTTILSMPNGTTDPAIGTIECPKKPSVTSAVASLVSASSATVGGNLVYGYGLSTERGVLYSSIISAPTIGNGTKASISTNTINGTFSQSVTGLSPVTTYYARAYATNVAGTAYGEVKTFTTLSNDATLSSLTISAGTLSPAFSAATTTYTASVSNATTSLTVAPSATNNGATVKLNGSSLQPVNLNIGTNTITVLVTAADNTTTKTYTLSITRAQTPQTITFDAGNTKAYGNADYAPGATTSSGLQLSYTSSNAAVATIVGSNVHIVGAGTTTITASQAGNATYFAAPDAVQTLTVNKAAVTVKADAKTKVYGNADPQFTYVITSGSLVSGDSFTGNLTRDGSGTGNEALLSRVGEYNITQGTLALNADKYDLTFTGDKLVVSKRPITLEPASRTKNYGEADPYLNAFRFVSGTLAPGHATTGEFKRVSGENAGTYAISGLGTKAVVELGTNSSEFVTDNYAITITPGIFSLTPKPITITANTQAKSYGDADPELTYTTDVPLIGSDTFTGALSRATGEAIGNYAITKGTLTSGNNYRITYTGSSLTIGKKTINVVANAATKTYGSADPAFSYTADALKAGDAFTGSLSRAAGENVGVYALNQGTLVLNSNYVLNFTGANLSIGKQPLTVTANPVSKTYGSPDPALTYTATGLMNGETLTGSLVRAAGESIGSYAVSQGTLTATANYDLVYTGDNLTINKATLTYVARPVIKFYTQGNPTFTGAVTGFVNGDSEATATTGTLSFSSTATNGSQVGFYPITGAGLTAANYNLVQASGNSTALEVKRSGNADLASMRLDAGTISPAFNPQITEYTASVPENVTFTYLFLTADPLAEYVALNGALVFGGRAPVYSLKPGNNSFFVTVYAQDYTQKRYNITINRALSSNNLLSNLSIDGATISPSFNANTLTYTASVPNTTTSVNVRAGTVDWDAKLSIQGTEGYGTGASKSVPLNVGANTAYVTCTATDGSVRNYSIVITRAKSSDATLASLGNTALTYTSAFSSATTNYAGRAQNSYTESTTFLPVPTNNMATITVNGQALNTFAGNFVRLNFGNNPVSIVVTSEDGNATKTYTVNAIRPRSSVAALTNLTIPFGGTINESFDPAVYSYTGNVPDSNYTGLRLNIARADITATVKVNGVSVDDPAQYHMALHGGTNKFKIEVTSQDTSASKTYQLVVTRAGQAPPAQSANASLLAINVSSSSGEGGGGFSYNVNFAYQQLEPVSVPNAVSSLYLYAYAEDANATVIANGQIVSPDNGYGPISLIVGENIINVLVTAEDGDATRSYVMHITRLPYVNVDLANLTVNKGTLSPAFAAGTTNYRVTVPGNTTDIAVRPVVSAAGNTVTIAGQPAISGKSSIISVPYFPYSIRTVVTSADGVTKKTYRLTVDRELSHNTTLNTFKLNPSSSIKAISATPESAVYSYSVSTDVTKVNFSAVAPEASTWFTINGEYATSGVMSADIPLTGQSTLITLVANAEDGVTTRTYQITVNKTGSANANLTKLIPGTGSLSPVFAANTVAYEVPVSYNTTSITLKPTVAEGSATVKVNGQDVISGSASAPVALVVGDNAISTEVTAASGFKKVYVVTVKRARSNNVVLGSFKLNPASSLVKGTNTAALASFTMSVNAATTKVNFSAILDDADASFTIDGLPATSGVLSSDIILAGYSTSIDAVVTAADGVTTKTYHIDVLKAGSINANLSKLVLSAGTLDPKFAANTTSYTATVSNLTSSITVTPTVGESSATVKVNGNAVTSGTASAPVALTVGSNAISIAVTSGNGNTKVYTVDVTREAIYQVQSTGDRNKPTALARDEKPATPLETVAVTVHQAVSPNGDGVNDKLTIDGILAYPENALKVMNRNGQVVFEAKGYDNYTNAFDGHGSDGKLQQAGTYFYSLEYKDGQQVKRQTGYLVIKY